MLLTTTETVPGKSVKEIIGVVSGSAVYMMDGSAAPEELYNDAIKRAIANLEKEAGLIDVDSVIGLHTAVTALGANQIIVTITGTAVALEGADSSTGSGNGQRSNKIEVMKREVKEEESQQLSADAAPQETPHVAAAVAPAPAASAAADTQVSALEQTLINMLVKYPDGMDGVGISKKIPRIYYSPSEVSSALKHLVEVSKLNKDEFGVFRISGQNA